MRSAVLLLALPLAVHAQSAAVAERVEQRVQAYLDSLHAGARFPGAQVGIALPDGRMLALAVGWSDTARKERMTTSHRLLSGSVGKTYASAVALQLIHEGKIGLDDAIAKYLGNEPWFALFSELAGFGKPRGDLLDALDRYEQLTRLVPGA